MLRTGSQRAQSMMACQTSICIPWTTKGSYKRFPVRRAQKVSSIQSESTTTSSPITFVTDVLALTTTNASTGEPRKVSIRWIKGHSGNKLHEIADRHAARVAFSPTRSTEGRAPKDTQNFPHALYFYECLLASSRVIFVTMLRHFAKKDTSRNGGRWQRKTRWPK